MKKLLLCLTAVICFSLLNVATANPMNDCVTRMDGEQYREALPFCQKACNLNYALGCFAIGLLYNNGQGVRQDYQQAKTYYEKACNLNDGAGCSNLGVLYIKGQGVRQNFQTAKEYSGRGCDLGFQTGCDNYRKLNEEGY